MRETMITVAGNVGARPTYFEPTPGTEAKMVLTVATTRRVRDRDSGEWRDGNTSWYDVWLQGRLAENAQQSIAKGDAVIVSGHVEIRPWQDGDKSGKKAVISAWHLGPDLGRYPVSISRVRVATSEQGQDHGQGDTGQGDTGQGDTGQGDTGQGDHGQSDNDHGGTGDAEHPGDTDGLTDLSDFTAVDEDGHPLTGQQAPESIVEQMTSGT